MWYLGWKNLLPKIEMIFLTVKLVKFPFLSSFLIQFLWLLRYPWHVHVTYFLQTITIEISTGCLKTSFQFGCVGKSLQIEISSSGLLHSQEKGLQGLICLFYTENWKSHKHCIRSSKMLYQQIYSLTTEWWE